GGREHDGLLWLAGHDAPEDRLPVESGHEQVQDDQVVRLGRSEAESLASLRRDVDGEALAAEPTRDEIQDPLFIVDEQDSRRDRLAVLVGGSDGPSPFSFGRELTATIDDRTIESHPPLDHYSS